MISNSGEAASTSDESQHLLSSGNHSEAGGTPNRRPRTRENSNGATSLERRITIFMAALGMASFIWQVGDSWQSRRESYGILFKAQWGMPSDTAEFPVQLVLSNHGDRPIYVYSIMVRLPSTGEELPIHIAEPLKIEPNAPALFTTRSVRLRTWLNERQGHVLAFVQTSRSFRQKRVPLDVFRILLGVGIEGDSLGVSDHRMAVLCGLQVGERFEGDGTLAWRGLEHAGIIYPRVGRKQIPCQPVGASGILSSSILPEPIDSSTNPDLVRGGVE